MTVRQQRRVLVVEDASSLRNLITNYLRANGMRVDSAWTVAGARRALSIFRPEIVLLDLGLEDGDGLELIPEILRARGQCLVISARDQASDRIQALELGAEDYMTKPIDLRELLLRLRRLSRMVQESPDVTMEVGGIKIDIAQRALVDSTGSVFIHLTGAEFRLMRLFLDRIGQPIDRQTIAKHVLSMSCLNTSRAIDVLVSKVRRKLTSIHPLASLQNVRGLGYMLQIADPAPGRYFGVQDTQTSVNEG